MKLIVVGMRRYGALMIVVKMVVEVADDGYGRHK